MQTITILRAWCPKCRDLTVSHETKTCRVCDKPHDASRYEFIEVDSITNTCAAGEARAVKQINGRLCSKCNGSGASSAWVSHNGKRTRAAVKCVSCDGVGWVGEPHLTYGDFALRGKKCLDCGKQLEFEPGSGSDALQREKVRCHQCSRKLAAKRVAAVLKPRERRVAAAAG